jgi:DNA-binding response OmpR family regulator
MGEASSIRVLVVTPTHSQEPIGAALIRAGYSVRCTHTGDGAAQSLRNARPDAIVLQTQALDRRATEVLTVLAAEHGVPLLAVHRASDTRSLVARIDAVVGRRPAKGDETEILTLRDLSVDPTRHAARVGDRPLNLTQKEFDLAVHLLRRPGWVFNRQQLLDAVWGDRFTDPRVVTVHICNLRRKLGDTATTAKYIETIRNVGYRSTEPLPSNAAGANGPARPPPGSLANAADRIPFVGREREFAALEHAFASVMNGQVRAVAVTGDAGIGKTRLAEEFAQCAGAVGAATHWGWCHDTLRRPAYGLWAEILGDLRVKDSSGGPTSVFPRSGSHAVVSMADTKGARTALFERLTQALRQLAEEEPIVLILEDLQWASTSSLLALQHVIRHLRGVRLMLLVTHRSSTPGCASQLVDVVADVARSDSGLILPLHPFSPSEVSRFVELIWTSAVNAEMQAEVYRQTEGNPFFLTQFAHLLALQPDQFRTWVGSLDLSRDEGVRMVILESLSRLSPSCRRWLDAASILGQEFMTTVLEQVIDPAPRVPPAAVAEAVGAGIVLPVEGAPERFRFAHSLIQEVLYNELPPTDRATLHARAGSVLERLYADELDQRAATLARHYSAAAVGCADKAVDFCLRAGQVAVSQYAWEEACSLWRRSIGLVDHLPVGAPQRGPLFVGHVYEEMGDAYSIAGDVDQTVEAYEDALSRLPREERVWRARLKRKQSAQFHLSAQHHRAQTALMEAESLLGRPEEASGPGWWHESVQIRLEQGTLHYHAGEIEELETLLADVRTAVAAHGTPEQTLELEQLLFRADLRRNRFVANAETITIAHRCAEHLRATGSARALLDAEMNLVLAYVLSPEERVHAYGHLMCYWELAKHNHDVRAQVYALGALAFWHRLRGDVERVREYSMQHLAMSEDRHLVAYEAEARGDLAWVAWRTNDTQTTRTYGSAGLKELEQQIPRSAFEWHVRWPLLGLSLADGDAKEAVRHGRAMLHPSQQKMPDDLEDTLSRFVQECDRRTRPTTTAQELTAVAASYGYL